VLGVRRGVFLSVAVLAALGVSRLTTLDGALAGWQNIAAKLATLL
jgi:hypothetical protein